MQQVIDIFENEIHENYPKALEILLFDHTTKKNIFWATNNYEKLGKGYSFHDSIVSKLITGENGNVIMPRVKKETIVQLQRIRDKAEVFTPSWVCNAQNNLIDNAWFNRENVFNTEINEKDEHYWISNFKKIKFPKGKTWKDYVKENRMEIACGEAPYITSRYDATTGEYIQLENRIGLLDRKLRIISENVNHSGDWLKTAQMAYQSTYAYEWQGDSLLLAREAMLYTFIDFYRKKFNKEPQIKSVESIAYIISWNVWQMDGLRCVVPQSCATKELSIENLFGEQTTQKVHCEGCKNNNIHKHNGNYCLIRNWKKKDKEKQIVRFVDLIKN